jgi:hypothetical protein
VSLGLLLSLFCLWGCQALVTPVTRLPVP